MGIPFKDWTRICIFNELKVKPDKMKVVLKLFIVLFVFGLTSCRDTKAEEAEAEEVVQQIESIEEETEAITEEIENEAAELEETLTELDSL
jgi:cell division protein FtsB